MRSESELIPYAPGRLDGSPLLVLAPHPDDEVFGCGGVLAQAAAAGAALRIVILTDGQAQGDGETRRQESLAAMQRLGAPEPEFWGLEDRSLEANDPQLQRRLHDLLKAVRPRVVLVPSPAEIHPDHRALALSLYRVLHTAVPGSELGEALSWLRVATYEVSAVLRPSLLVDVTAEWDTVLAAAEAYASQLEQLPYIEVFEAIATARRLTLPSAVQRAEAYHVVDMAYVRTHSAHEWAAAQGPSAVLEEVPEAASLDVVVITRGRLHLLSKTLESLLSQVQPAARVVVVDVSADRQVAVDPALGDRIAIEVVGVPEGKDGFAAAARIGLESATARHVVLVDEGDVLLPEHLFNLGQALARGVAVAVSAVAWGGKADSSDSKNRWRAPMLRPEIDRLPLAAVAFPRRKALKAGGFDAELDGWEGNDLLLRLAGVGEVVRLEQVSCEHHKDPGQKTDAEADDSELKTLVSLWRRNGLLRRPRELAAAVTALRADRDELAFRVQAADRVAQRADAHADRLRAEVGRLQVDLDGLDGAEGGMPSAEGGLPGGTGMLSAELESGREPDPQDADERVKMLEAEVARLKNLLESIYATKVWRLRQTIERLRGRR